MKQHQWVETTSYGDLPARTWLCWVCGLGKLERPEALTEFSKDGSAQFEEPPCIDKSEVTVEERCETCRFMRESQCRRRPPKAFVVLAPQNYLAGATMLMKTVSAWPQVAEGQWCGEWEGR
jgi:hypothetical protein